MVSHMLRFIRDDRGLMGLTLSQIGLMIATGILLAAVFSLVFYNDWQRNAELKNIATSFSFMVEGMDSRFFEDVTAFCFPDKNYYYNVSVSTEYIVVSSSGFFGSDLSVKERFLVKPWPLINSSLWMGGVGLHNFLKNNYGKSGNVSDPVQNVGVVKAYLDNESREISVSLALNPMHIFTNKTVSIDKAYVYYDNNGDGVWSEDEEKQSFLFVYQ